MTMNRLATLLVGVAVLAGCNGGDGDESRPTPQPPSAQPPGQVEPEGGQPSGPAAPHAETSQHEAPAGLDAAEGEGASVAEITVDGDAEDWSEVPVASKVAAPPARSTNYDCRSIKIARDGENLYLLFTLGRGIREKFEQEMQEKGRAGGGALGYLHLSAGGREITSFIMTGVQSSYDLESDEVVAVPLVAFDVTRARSGQDAGEEVYEAESTEQPESVAFDGKHLELAIPLEKLDLPPHGPIEVRLEEM